MSQELPNLDPEGQEVGIDELVSDFARQEKKDGKPLYSFQTRDEFFEEFKPRRIKPGKEGYEDAYEGKVKPEFWDVGEPKDEYGVTESQEMEVSEVVHEDLEDIASGYWWLTPEYQRHLERGELVEQVAFSIEIGEKKRTVSVYIFGEPLPAMYISWLSEVIDYLAQIDEGNVFNLIKGIIIHNSEKEVKGQAYSEKTGKMMDVKTAAHANYSIDVIEVFRGGLNSDTGVLLENFPFFMEALVHEFGHFIQYRTLKQGWKERLGWEEETVKEKKLRKDGTPSVMHKKRSMLIPKHGFVPPSVYALTSPVEDFAESFAFLLLEPEKLDPKKRDWMIEEVVKQKAVLIKDRPKVDMAILTGEEIEIPRVTRDNLSYDTSYRVELGRGGVDVFLEKIRLRSESKKTQGRIKKFLPKNTESVEVNTTPRLRYDWWTRKPETKGVFDKICSHKYIKPSAHIVENILRYFSPEFIREYFEGIFNELEGIESEQAALKEVLSKRMLELSSIIASRMDLREDLSLLSSIQFFKAW